jgi:hypothetical protein
MNGALEKDKYGLKADQVAAINALAQARQVNPGQLVREAVAQYLAEVDYQRRRAAVMASLQHPERDNTVFGAWRGADIDGVEYQNELRGK